MSGSSPDAGPSMARSGPNLIMTPNEMTSLALRVLLDRLKPSSLALAAVSCSLAGTLRSAEEGQKPLPDKSGYNLFHPTPHALMRELSADRPDKTDCPFTVDAGHFQVEMDFANLTYNRPNSERGNVRFTGVQAAPVNLKIGLLNNLDFQFVCVPYRWDRTEDRDAGTVERKSGFDGVTPRCKINLVGNDGGFFALALIPFVKLPVSQGRLGNGSVEGGLAIPYAFDLHDWDLGFQSTVRLNRNQTGSGHHTEFENSVSLGHPLLGKLSVSAEFFGGVSTERGAGWVGTVDTWLTYQLSGNWRLDGGVYIGVTPAADDWHPFVGMTWRF